MPQIPKITIRRPYPIPGLLPGEWATNPLHRRSIANCNSGASSRRPSWIAGDRFYTSGHHQPNVSDLGTKIYWVLRLCEFCERLCGCWGEAIDVMRCMLFAAGHTYLNRKGEEVVIPKDQWGEVFSGPRMNLSGAKGVVYGGGWGKTSEAVRSLLDNSDKPHDAYGKRLTPREMGMRATECLFLNWLTDGLVAAKGKATRQMAKDLRLNLGPLGIDSQIAMMNGDPAYAGVFDLNL